LCWGSWPYLPPISSGWVVVGVWTKMIGQLEETSPELFLSICSSRLEASQACLQRLQLFLKMGVTVSVLFIFHVSRSKLGVVDSLGAYISTWRVCMLFTMIYANVCTCVLVMDDYIRGAYTLRIGSGPLHDGWHSTWSQKGLLLSQWSPSWRQYRGSVGNRMAYAPIITSLNCQRRVGVYTNLNLD
jgi:hypothetical protein